MNGFVFAFLNWNAGSLPIPDNTYRFIRAVYKRSEVVRGISSFQKFGAEMRQNAISAHFELLNI